MFRDNSKQKLTRSTSKQKIKQTIRIAMGKQPIPIEVPPSSQQQPRTRRSESTKSLRSFHHNKSSIQSPYKYPQNLSKYQDPDLHRNNSQSVFNHVGKFNISMSEKELDVGRESKMGSRNGVDVVGVEWWHESGFQVDSQSKVSIVNGQKQQMRYYAYKDTKTNKKHILAALENGMLYIGNSQFLVYLINTQKRTIESVNSRTEKIKLNNGQITQILIVGKNQPKMGNQDRSQKLSIITTGALFQPRIQKVIMEGVMAGKTKFFDVLTRQTIEKSNQIKTTFYLCLHLQRHMPEKQEPEKKQSSNIIAKILERKIQGQIKPQNKSTKISEHALLKYKK